MVQRCAECQAWKDLAFSYAQELRALFDRLEAVTEVVERLQAQLVRYAEDLQRAYQTERVSQQGVERLREEARAEQGRLLGIAAHEMRNPLTVIQGFSDLLMQRSFPPEQTQELLRDIHGYAEHLDHLLSDLLNYHQSGAGRLSLQPKTVDLLPLLWEAVDARKSPSGQHPIAFEVPDMLPPVWADPVRLRQVLDNLLSNARKYSPPGRAIRLEATVSDRAVCVSVADAGLGIPSDQLETIFQPFYRLPRDAGSETPGTGLGLSIVRQLVELHGGRIWAESAGEGHGTTFTFTLPRASRQ